MSAPPPPPPKLPPLGPSTSNEPDVLKMVRELRTTIRQMKRAKTDSPKRDPRGDKADMPPELSRLPVPKQLDLSLGLESRLALQNNPQLRESRVQLDKVADAFSKADIGDTNSGKELARRILLYVRPVQQVIESLPPVLAELPYMKQACADVSTFPLKRYSLAISFKRYVDKRKALASALNTTILVEAETLKQTWEMFDARMFGAGGHVESIEKHIETTLNLVLEQDRFLPEISEQEKNLVLLGQYRKSPVELVRLSIASSELNTKSALAALGVGENLVDRFERSIFSSSEKLILRAFRDYIARSSEIIRALWQYYEELRAKNSPRQIASLVDVSNTILLFYRRVSGYRRVTPFYAEKGLRYNERRPLRRLVNSEREGLQGVINEAVRELRSRLSEIDIDTLSVNSMVEPLFCDACGSYTPELLVCSSCQQAYYCESECRDEFQHHVCES